MRYFDASALVRRYVRETGRVKVRRLLSSDVSATSRLSAVEITSALMRRSREGRLWMRSAIAPLPSSPGTWPLCWSSTPDIVARAQALLKRHTLCACDAIQLASCLFLQEELGEETTLVAFDERLAAAARREELKLA